MLTLRREPSPETVLLACLGGARLTAQAAHHLTDDDDDATWAAVLSTLSQRSSFSCLDRGSQARSAREVRFATLVGALSAACVSSGWAEPPELPQAAYWEQMVAAAASRCQADDGVTPMFTTNPPLAVRLLHRCIQGLLFYMDYVSGEFESLGTTAPSTMHVDLVVHAIQTVGRVVARLAASEVGRAGQTETTAEGRAQNDMHRTIRDDTLVLLSALLRFRGPLVQDAGPVPLLEGPATVMAALSTRAWTTQAAGLFQGGAPSEGATATPEEGKGGADDQFCLFASTTAPSAPTRSNALSRTSSSISLRSSSAASTSTLGPKTVRDVLIRSLTEAFGGVWSTSVDALACLARLMLGVSSSPVVGAGPDRRAASVFGSHSLYASLDVIVPWALEVEKAISLPTCDSETLQWWRLRLQSEWSVGPLLKDVVTCPMTSGLCRDWSGHSTLVSILCSAYHAHHATSMLDVGGSVAPATTGAKRGVSFATSRPPTQPAATLLAPATVDVKLTAAERVATVLISSPPLAVLVQYIGASRAIMVAATPPSGRGDDESLESYQRRSAVATVLHRCCADSRLIALWGGPATEFVYHHAMAESHASTRLRDKDRGAAAEMAHHDLCRAREWAAFVGRADTVTAAFGATAKLVASVCHGSSVIPPLLHRFLAPALLTPQPTAQLPARIATGPQRLALRASDVERWAVLSFAAAVSKLHPGIRAGICNLAANRSAPTVNESSTAHMPSWQMIGISAVIGDAVAREHSPDRLRTLAVTTVSLQPMHIAPDQRVVERVFTEIANASAAGLVTKRKLRRPTTVDDAVDDAEGDATDEEEEMVLQSPHSGGPRGTLATTAAPDDASTVSSYRDPTRDVDDAGLAAGSSDVVEGSWTPMLCNHWLVDTCLRWACRAKLFNERDCAISASAPPELRRCFAAEALEGLPCTLVPLPADPDALAPSRSVAKPWYRSIDAFTTPLANGGMAHIAPSSTRHHFTFQLEPLPVLFQTVLQEAVQLISEQGYLSRPRTGEAVWGGRNSSRLTAYAPNKESGGVAQGLEGGRSSAATESQLTLAQRPHSRSSVGTPSGVGGAIGRKQRMAMIEQLTSERDGLREELASLHATYRVAESRTAELSHRCDEQEEEIEQQYCRIMALADALVRARERDSDARATAASAYAMLEREKQHHDVASARQAELADDLAAAREATHGLEARLMFERRDTDDQLSATRRDMSSLAKHVEELEASNVAKDRHIQSLEAKLEGFMRLSAAIGGLAGQMR